MTQRLQLFSLAPYLLAAVLALASAWALIRMGTSTALMLAGLPAAIIVFAALALRDRAVLLFGALGLGIVGVPLNSPVSLGSQLFGSTVFVYPTDALLLLAVASWLVSRLFRDSTGEGSRDWRWPPVVGWPLLLFGVCVVYAVVRGHDRYGLGFLSEPLRLILYAGIATTLPGLDSRKAYSGIVTVFYAGAAFEALNGIYLLGTGGSQTGSANLSTGGTRVLALSVSLYLAGALYLALLNLAVDHSSRRRFLHMAVAGMALFGIILAYGRGTFAAVAVVLAALFVSSPALRRRVVTLLPLYAPLVVLAVLLVARTAPDVGPTLAARVTDSLLTDYSVEWRQRANGAVLQQFHESPVTGVGFGRDSTFAIGRVTYTVSQDPHNSFLFLLAGGGIITLGAFLLICAVFARDAWVRAREATQPHERILVAWAGLTLFTFLVNAIAEPLFSWPSLLLTIWALLVLPGLVPRRPARQA